MRRLCCIALGLFFCFYSFSQVIPLDTAVHTGVLANGFTYYIRHSEEPKHRVELYLVNKVGSVLEDDSQQGLAHFMEHMNFNGTKHFPKNELVDYLQKSGVRFGADLNAYTSFDETVYQLPLPTDYPAILRNGFQIMRDWAQDALLDSSEIDNKRGVVLEEARLGKGAGERMQRVYWPVMLNHSRYASRIPIGKEDILKTFPYEAIRRYHHDWYRPDLQALIVVGDIDVQATEVFVKQLFSDLKNPEKEQPRIEYKVPLTGANQFVAVTDKEMPQTDIQVLIKHKAIQSITEQDYLQGMKTELSNIMLGARLDELMQQANPPFVQVQAGIEGFIGGLDMFAFDVLPKQGLYGKAFEAAWEAVERVKRFGFTESELARAKQNYLSSMEASYAERNKNNSTNFVGEYQRLFLNKESSPGIAWEYAFVKNKIGGITVNDINVIVADYIKDSNRDVLVLGPDAQKAALPDSAAVAGWMVNVAASQLTAYKDEASNKPLLSALLASGKVVSEKKLQGINATEITFANGAKVILKPTDFKNDEIKFSAFHNGGTSLYPDKDFQSAANAGLIAGMGVADFNPVHLNKLLAGKRLNVAPYIGERSEGLDGLAAPSDLTTALQLMYAYFTQPRKDTTLFNNIINNSREGLEHRYSEPGNVYKDTCNYVLGGYNYRRSAPTVAKLNQIDLDKAFEIYKERFSDANAFTFVFVGAFDVDSIKPLLAQYIGGLPSKHKAAAARDLGIHIPAGTITKKVYAGTENKATLRMVFSGDYTFSAANNLLLQALNEAIQIKFDEVLREKEGEVYSPSIQTSLTKYPRNRYSFQVYLGCAPANVDHLASLVLNIVDSMKLVGPGDASVEKFKAEFTRQHELQLHNNNYWLNYLFNQYYNNDNVDDVNSYNKRLEAITPAAVQVAAKQYLTGRNVIELVLLPETGSR